VSVFHVLIVRGDGRRLLRINVSRWILRTGFALLALGVVMEVALVLEHAALRQRWRQADRLAAHLGDGRDLIEEVRQRLPEIQREIEGWRELHARISAPLVTAPSPARTSEFPAASTKSGEDTDVDRLLATVREEGERLRALERLTTRAGKILAVLPSRWPLRGAINSKFGRRASPTSGAPEFHEGIDIAAGVGTPVTAPAPGVVTFAGSSSGYGNSVVLDHGQQIKTVFGHLQKIDVSRGQRVERGQQIALSGTTGRSTGPHLHYEVLVNGRPVNPAGYLRD
jgi:murein DD-endopeptidase MepM/ murein hydrolase activator NlpD